MYRVKNTKNGSAVQHSEQFFHMVIVGRTGCGKTKLLVKLLKTEFLHTFHAIFLICPTFEKNRGYDDPSLFMEKKFYVCPKSVEKLEDSIDLVRKEAVKYERSLVILDDVIGNSMMTSRVGKFVNLLIGGRHDGISTISLVQQLNSIAKPARDQLTRVISFYNPNAEDRKILFDQYLVDVDKQERKDIFFFLREQEYRYIDIDILRGRYQLH